jgi:hypothetical protein
MCNRKQLMVVGIVAFALLGGSLFAQEQKAQEMKRFGLDVGAGLSFGLMNESSSETAALDGLITFLSTFRGGLYASGQYTIVNHFSVGLRAGVYAITYGEGSAAATLIDIPLQGLARFSIGSIDLEAFGGYYISAVQSDYYNFAGPEVGARLSLWGLYASVSEVFASPAYTRIEVGYNFRNLLRF